MNLFVKGIAVCLMGVLMTGTWAFGGEIAVIETTLGTLNWSFCKIKHRGIPKTLKTWPRRVFTMALRSTG